MFWGGQTTRRKSAQTRYKMTSDIVFGLDEHEDESFLRFGSFIDDLYPLFLQLLGAKDGEANIRVSIYAKHDMLVFTVL